MFGIEKLLEKILNRQNTPKEQREEFNIDTKYVHGLLFYNSYFDKIASALKRETVAFIVGGWVRDRLLNREIGNKVDVDLLVTTDPWEIVKNLQMILGKGDIFKFEKETTVASIVFTEGNTRYRFDFSFMDVSDILNSNLDFQEKELKIVDKLNENLLNRDFTINAMAILFDDAIGMGASQTILFDPSNGLEDLNEGIIKPVSIENIKKDPVRILRGYRFSQELNFTLNKEFENWIKENKELIKDSPIERIRDELLKIFDKKHSKKTIEKLEEVGLLQLIIPQTSSIIPSEYEKKYSLQSLDKFDDFLKKKDDLIIPEVLDLYKPKQFLTDFTDITLSKLYLYLLIRNLNSKKDIQKVSKSLSLGEKVYKFLLLLNEALGELKNLNFYNTYSLSYWWYRYKTVAVNVFLIHLSLENEEEILKKLQNFYTAIYLKNVVEEPILSGKEIMEILNIPPSKEIGILKNELLKKQLTGQIRTKKQAISFIKNLYNNSSTK
ncbi:MAG: hypothetical protein DSY47_07305 [Hydrogenothermus sp.]|nr:MAG: hypothetical protein DSY47_07305 [Hydrogenothermus sp.]